MQEDYDHLVEHSAKQEKCYSASARCGKTFAAKGWPALWE